MSVSLTVTAVNTATEVLAGNSPAASNARKTVTHDQWGESHSLNGASSPPVSAIAIKQAALVSGVLTIDLTALTGWGTNGATVNGNGLKVQYLKLRNPATNANPIKVAVGASNGYAMHGSDWAITLQPGQWANFYGNNASPTIGSGAKNLDLTGTAAQALDVMIVMG